MNFLFTCGGTGGHIYPALSVADYLKKKIPDSDFLFIGAENNMEMDLVPREGYDIKSVKITYVSRGHGVKDIVHNAETIKNVAVSVFEAKKIIKEFKPDIVIGTGGYVCFPVLRAAKELHIKTAVHESNAVPGLTTKLVSEFADIVLVGMEDSRKHYKNPDKVYVTGTPVRKEFSSLTYEQARQKLGVPVNKPLVLSVWGSLGSEHMNDIICEMIPLTADDSFKMIHSTGSLYYDSVISRTCAYTEKAACNNIELRKYIYDMPTVLSAADLVICRAGASTLAELTYLGKPALIVPSPNVTNNHQEKNARVLERAGAAKVLLEGEFDAVSFRKEICSILEDHEKLKKMSENMKALSYPDAVEEIANKLIETVNK